MSEYAYRVYEGIVQATNSELILFFVILALVSIPLYVAVLKGRKADKQHERDRERQIMEVIKENTAVIAGLKVTLDNSADTTKSILERIHTRVDEKGKAINTVATDVAQIKSTQTEMISKVNKIMLIVNNLPANSNFSTQIVGKEGKL